MFNELCETQAAGTHGTAAVPAIRGGVAKELV